MRRGVLGGTFDPPHLGHLVAAISAMSQFDLDVVTFLPAGAPWQKRGRQVSSADHRWEMTLRSIAGVEGFEADDREVRRDGWTYTIDTLETFADGDLFLILGADAVARFRSWHRWRDVLARAELLVARRPGTSTESVTDAVSDVAWLDMPHLDISGTDLRDRVARGANVRFLVRDRVAAYIGEHALYERT